MTDLLNRPAAATKPGRRSAAPLTASLGRLAAAVGRRLRGTTADGGEAPRGRSLTLSAALAALGALGTTMLLCMALAVVGWFLADAGAHGETPDALLVGADVWLVAHGASLTVSGVPLSIVPLGASALIAMVLLRSVRWAAATSRPVEDDRAVLLAATVFTGIYVVVAVVTCVLLTQGAASPSLGRTVVGSFLLSGTVATLGLASGTGCLRGWVQVVPGWVRSVLHGGLVAFLALVGAAAVLVAVALLLRINEAASVTSQLQLGAGDYVMYALVTAALAPNAVLLGSAYLLGPGFAIGTGTVVSPTLVSLGPVPAFPLLAALPADGPTPSWVLGLMGVPVLAGAAGAVLAQRAYGVTAYDSAALRGFGGGLTGAVLITLAIALAGGPMGTGRMADIGAPVGEVLVAAVMAMSLGGLLAGLVTAWWQRR